MKDTSTDAALLRHARLQTIAIYAILLLLLAGAILIAAAFSGIYSSIGALEEGIGQIDAAALTETINSLRDTAEVLAETDITDTVTSLQTAADSLAGVDIPALNRAVTSLEGAAQNLGGVDVETLNSLVSALETVSVKLQNAVNGITGIFAR